MISVIHPSRGRAEKAFKTYSEWLKKATSQFEYKIVIDKDDAVFQDYYELFLKESIVVGDSSNVVEAMNLGAKNASGDIFVCISDDFNCPDAWDKYIVNHLDSEKEQALLVNDGHGDHLMMTIPILTKKLYDKLGYVYHPSFTGMFADNALAEICDRMGVLVKNRDSVFLHEHWIYGHYTADATNKRHDNSEGWRIGKKVIEKLRANNYGL